MGQADPTNAGSKRVLFEQVQPLDPFVLKLVLLIEAPTTVFVIVMMVIAKVPWHVIAIVLGLMAAAPILIAKTKLVVRVREDRLRAAFPPWWGTSVPYEDLEAVEVEHVDAMRDFMGWGVKLTTGATGYIARSGGGVRITRIGKKRALVISSDEPEALAAAILERVVAAGEAQLQSADS